MRFWLLDAIESFEPGVRLRATKNVSYSEEYLQDHFPEFPVLPGVFMLEAATQACAWLLRLTDDYAHSVIALHQARNVKYAEFVTPGRQLQVTVEQLDQTERFVTFKVQGEQAGRPTLTGKLVLERYNLADTRPDGAEIDARICDALRRVGRAIAPRDAVAAAP